MKGPVCVKKSIAISTVAVQVLLQKRDFETAISLTGVLFPFTDHVMSKDTHSILAHLWLRHCARVWSACCWNKHSRHDTITNSSLELSMSALCWAIVLCVKRSNNWWARITFYQGHVPHSSERMDLQRQ